MSWEYDMIDLELGKVGKLERFFVFFYFLWDDLKVYKG